jgi:hypothetical protein
MGVETDAVRKYAVTSHATALEEAPNDALMSGIAGMMSVLAEREGDGAEAQDEQRAVGRGAVGRDGHPATSYAGGWCQRIVRTDLTRRAA